MRRGIEEQYELKFTLTAEPMTVFTVAVKVLSAGGKITDARESSGTFILSAVMSSDILGVNAANTTIVIEPESKNERRARTILTIQTLAYEGYLRMQTARKAAERIAQLILFEASEAA